MFNNSKAIKTVFAVACYLGSATASAGEVENIPQALSEHKTDYSLQHAKGGGLIYRGVANFDNAGIKMTGMLYPAPSAAGLIASVLTHGLLTSTAKSEQKNKIQADADKVLLPYQSVINNINHEELLSLAIVKFPGDTRVQWANNETGHEHDPVVESNLIISMTQDQSALILDNAITITKWHDATKADYHASIRVVSPVQAETAPSEYWTKNNGERLKEISAELIADSLQIAIHDAEALKSAPDSNPFRTIRYKEGETEKFERAQIVSNECSRVLIRTLKGDLMSVPVSRPIISVGETNCLQTSSQQHVTSSLQ